jgi:hypothetical protein
VRAASDKKRSARVVTCGACRCLSSLRWTGWRAYLVEDPEELEEPGMLFLCPACAALEEFSRGA